MASWIFSFVGGWHWAAKPIAWSTRRSCLQSTPSVLVVQWEPWPPPPSPLPRGTLGTSSGVWFWQARGLGGIQSPSLRAHNLTCFWPILLLTFGFKGGSAVLFENTNQSQTAWSLFPGKMTGQIFIKPLRNEGGRGSLFPSTVAGSCEPRLCGLLGAFVWFLWL